MIRVQPSKRQCFETDWNGGEVAPISPYSQQLLHETSRNVPSEHIVDEMDTEIVEVESIIERMVLFRARLARTRNQHILLSRLPTEIMAEIFFLCLATSPIDSSPPVATTIPLVLGAVCRSWRSLAWSLPQLWATFH